MAKSKDDHVSRFHGKQEREKQHAKQLPTDEEPQLPPPVEPIRVHADKPQRNDPCPCGSGKKYKKCCGQKAT